MASELSDKLLAEILELDAELTVTMHIQTVDQLKAIKTIKGKISDIGRMKAEEQKKAVRAGYDMEILPPDLITFSKDAAELLSDLQSRNERMFLLTFTVVNLAPTRQRLENDVFTVSGMKEKSYFKGVPPSLPPKGSRCDGRPYWRGIGCMFCYREQLALKTGGKHET